ncbi:hypothetical protein [Bremerella sp. P1]|uniref:hypothetical protein n=1 Tax=Bremerella sp. P1 TaxID=3026424 RepID=UPI0023688C2B|nr:hypothetical protein [Bremerella sp. P1]WDI41819.1 hypothetical protein PSR63_25540 [Bremerella sp. P1]
MPVNFEESGARRIVGATKWVERHKKNPVRKRGGNAHRGDGGWWAKITGQDATDKFKYTWKFLEPQDVDESSDALAENNAFLQGVTDEEPYNYAVEIYRSIYVVKNDIVWITPSRNQEYYLFEYVPGSKLARLPAANSITARSADTPGQGTVTIESAEWTGSSFTIGDTEEELTVFNNFATAITTDSVNFRYVDITYFQSDRAWFVTGAGCS